MPLDIVGLLGNIGRQGTMAGLNSGGTLKVAGMDIRGLERTPLGPVMRLTPGLGQAMAARDLFNEAYGAEDELRKAIMGQATGRGPSVAQGQTDRALAQAIQGQRAMAASAPRSISSGAAHRLASQNIGNLQARAGEAGALARLAEQQQAVQTASGILNANPGRAQRTIGGLLGQAQAQTLGAKGNYNPAGGGSGGLAGGVVGGPIPAEVPGLMDDAFRQQERERARMGALGGGAIGGAAAQGQAGPLGQGLLGGGMGGARGIMSLDYLRQLAMGGR